MIEANDSIAYEYMHAASDAGYGPAQFYCGVMLAHERGVDQSQAAAVRMYRAAASGGMARAQLILAWRLAEGRGCDMDTMGSLLYLEDAVLSARKDSDAADDGTGLVGEGHGSMIDHGAGAPEPVSTKGFPQQPASALELFVRAAEAGHPAAKYQLGYLYENGVGIVEKDEYQAIEWYESAAACNFPAAGTCVRCGSVWVGVGRYGSVWVGVGRCGSVRVGVGRCGSTTTCVRSKRHVYFFTTNVGTPQPNSACTLPPPLIYHSLTNKYDSPRPNQSLRSGTYIIPVRVSKRRLLRR